MTLSMKYEEKYEEGRKEGYAEGYAEGYHDVSVETAKKDAGRWVGS